MEQKYLQQENKPVLVAGEPGAGITMAVDQHISVGQAARQLAWSILKDSGNRSVYFKNQTALKNEGTINLSNLTWLLNFFNSNALSKCI
jgi:hypothetical protein